jgi:hypothetical protein
VDQAAAESEVAALVVLLNNQDNQDNLVHLDTDLQAASRLLLQLATVHHTTVVVEVAVLVRQAYEETHLQELILFQGNHGAAAAMEDRVLSPVHFLLVVAAVVITMMALE